VLNQYFEKRWLPLPEKYNHFVSSRMIEYQRPRIPLDGAVLVHFLGRPKPWNADENTGVDADHRQALALWRAEAAAIVR
jgi:lipopolysaccharide biosynthesis glycosyltransferase